MDAVFKALADPTRRKLLDRLAAEGGQNLGALVARLPISRQGASKHLAVLEAAGLVTTLWNGREKLHYLNPVPIQAIAERWMNRFAKAQAASLLDLKRELEGKTQ